ncbi:hypothetical protein GM3709_13 [Geminocystis sp. NIES-3709]|nr:hypothetical protein GM3709_13 [Geminocystis sp. NIES-3709]
MIVTKCERGNLTIPDRAIKFMGEGRDQLLGISLFSIKE